MLPRQPTTRIARAGRPTAPRTTCSRTETSTCTHELKAWLAEERAAVTGRSLLHGLPGDRVRLDTLRHEHAAEGADRHDKKRHSRRGEDDREIKHLNFYLLQRPLRACLTGSRGRDVARMEEEGGKGAILRTSRTSFGVPAARGPSDYWLAFTEGVVSKTAEGV